MQTNKIIKMERSKKKKQLHKLYKKQHYGENFILDFLIKKMKLFTFNLKTQQHKQELLKKHSMIIYYKLEMENVMDSIFIEEKMKKQDSLEVSLKINVQAKSLDKSLVNSKI